MAKRMYGLFEKVDGKWVRLYPSLAYHKERAIRVFQDALIGGFMLGKTVELRVIKNEVAAQQIANETGQL